MLYKNFAMVTDKIRSEINNGPCSYGKFSESK